MSVTDGRPALLNDPGNREFFFVFSVCFFIVFLTRFFEFSRSLWTSRYLCRRSGYSTVWFGARLLWPARCLPWCEFTFFFLFCETFLISCFFTVFSLALMDNTVQFWWFMVWANKWWWIVTSFSICCVSMEISSGWVFPLMYFPFLSFSIFLVYFKF